MGDVDEPLLTYTSLCVGTTMSSVLKADAGTALACGATLIAIGTRSGALFIVSLSGVVIGSARKLHTGPITYIAIDDDDRLIVSATNVAGKVIVIDLKRDERRVISYTERVQALAFRPKATSLVRSFSLGDISGRLIINASNWLSNEDSVLHSGEGPVTSITWNGALIAWSNSLGVKVFDLSSRERVAFVPHDRPDLHCHLVWMSTETLVIAWGHSVNILKVEHAQGRLISQFTTEFLIGGCVAYDEQVVLLAIFPATSRLPEIHIVSTTNELVSCTPLQLSGPIALGRVDRQIFILQADDIIVGRPRTPDDHIAYLLSRDNFEEAVRTARAAPGMLRRYHLDELTFLYLTKLIASERYEKAADDCHLLLGNNIALWEKWIAYCIEAGVARTMAAKITTGDDASAVLSHVTYNAVLSDLAASDPALLLTLLQTWPPSIYQPDIVLESTLRELPDSAALDECRAHLFQLTNQPKSAIQLLIKLGRDSVFALLSKHVELLASVDLPGLIAVDVHKAISMLVSQTAHAPVSTVVDAVRADRPLLHRYLHQLFLFNRLLGKEYHSDQVSLYAEFQPDMLLSLLQQSVHYRLEDALNVCREAALFPCQLYLLKRMGNNPAAVDLLVVALNDIEGAIAFVEETRSRSLRDHFLKLIMESPQRISDTFAHLRRGFICPVKFLLRIPDDIIIPDMKNKMSSLLAEYAREMSIREVSNDIMRADCASLLLNLRRSMACAIVIDPLCSTRCLECRLAVFRPGCKEGGVVVSRSGEVRHSACMAVSDRQAPR